MTYVGRQLVSVTLSADQATKLLPNVSIVTNGLTWPHYLSHPNLRAVSILRYAGAASRQGPKWPLFIRLWSLNRSYPSFSESMFKGEHHLVYADTWGSSTHQATRERLIAEWAPRVRFQLLSCAT